MRTLGGVVLVLVAVFSFPSCTVYKSHPVTSFADATGGEGFERAFWQDVRNKDWKDLQQHLASSFTYMGPSGTLDRDAALTTLQQMDLKDFSITDLKTQLSGNTVVVTYAITLRGTSGGQPLPDQPQQRMSVWHEHKSGWLVIAQAVLGPPASH
jgi:ketosteroid isomerase-like protein